MDDLIERFAEAADHIATIQDNDGFEVNLFVRSSGIMVEVCDRANEQINERLIVWQVLKLAGENPLIIEMDAMFAAFPQTN